MSDDPLAGEDWDALRRRSEGRRAAIRARAGDPVGAAGERAGPHGTAPAGRGPRTRDHDLHFYAASLGLAVRMVRPLVIVGKLINYAVAIVFLGLVAWGVVMLLEHGREPVDFLDVAAVRRDVPAGGKLDVRFDIVRRLVCQINPDFSFIGTDVRGNAGRKWTFAAQHMDVGGPPGHDPFVRSFDLPKDMAPGPARFRVAWSWVCPTNFVDLLFPRTAEVKDAPFAVMPP